jgi:hypothetical protein
MRKMVAVLPLLLTVYEEDGCCVASTVTVCEKMVAVLPILLTVYEEDGGCVASTVDCI